MRKRPSPRDPTVGGGGCLGARYPCKPFAAGAGGEKRREGPVSAVGERRMGLGQERLGAGLGGGKGGLVWLVRKAMRRGADA